MMRKHLLLTQKMEKYSNVLKNKKNAAGETERCTVPLRSPRTALILTALAKLFVSF